MSFSVTLTENEMRIIRILAELRSMTNRAMNVPRGAIDHAPNHILDIHGLMGEVAFCKHFNLYFDPTVNPRSGTYDCLYMGKRIDIKSTDHPKGNLITTMKINKDVDVYVLALIENNTVTFPGYCTAKNLYNPENIKDLGYGDTYVVERDQLTPWKNDD